MSSTETPSEASGSKPENTQRVAKTRVTRRLAAGGAFERMLGADGVAALKSRNWTITGAGLVALGVVADLSQIFAPIALIGLLLSLAAAVVFAVVVFLRMKWRDTCIGHTITAILTAGLFGVVLLIQQSADAEDTGAFAELFPAASQLQNTIHANVLGIAKKQGEIDAKIDQLADEVRQANEDARLSKDAERWVGTWVLETPYQPGWVVEYSDDGSYVFQTPQATVNGVYKAADGLFHTEAPGTGLSDAGSFRFRDENTLEMTGKFGMSVWKRVDGPQPQQTDD